jgi:hypothetical protein
MCSLALTLPVLDVAAMAWEFSSRGLHVFHDTAVVGLFRGGGKIFRQIV